MRTLRPDTPTGVAPSHGSNVIYADDTCIKVVTAEMVGGGGGFEVVAPIIYIIGFVLWLVETGNRLDILFVFGCIGTFLMVLPILLFRYKPNYLIFSRASQEIYYAKSKKQVFRMKWKDVTGQYSKVAVFTGGGVVRNEYLRIAGISDYPEGTQQAVSIAFAALSEENAIAQWAYFQEYMKNGVEGLEEAGVDHHAGKFFSTVKYNTKIWLLDFPRFFIYGLFHPENLWHIFLSLIFIPTLPLLFIMLVLVIWPGTTAVAFVNSTRTRAPMPKEFTKYITDNKESYGTATSVL